MDQGWESLPEHLSGLILEKLKSLKDCLRFGTVCVSWHAVMRSSDRVGVNNLLCHREAPMLLFPVTWTAWNIWDPMNNKRLGEELWIPRKTTRRFCGSSRGWLAGVNRDYTMTLYKPYSMVSMLKVNNNDATICLPRLLSEKEYNNLGSDLDSDEEAFFDNCLPRYPKEFKVRSLYDREVFKTLITADPLENKEECIILAWISYCNLLLYFRVAKDKTWSKFILWRNLTVEILHHSNKKFYALGDSGQVISFEIPTDESTDPCSTVGPIIEPVFPRHVKLPPRGSTIMRYFVDSGKGELLQVERYYHINRNGFRVTRHFRILKLDFDNQRWTELHLLGDSAMFLGDNSSTCVVASDFEGCQPNCIYFTHDIHICDRSPDKKIYDIGVYSLETKIFKRHFGMNSDVWMKMSACPPIFAMPTFN